MLRSARGVAFFLLCILSLSGLFLPPWDATPAEGASWALGERGGLTPGRRLTLRPELSPECLVSASFPP